MQTNNMSDITPKFIILASMSTGNHPFSHVASSEGDKAYLNIDGIKEILKDYIDQFIGTIFIGRRSGFMDENNNELKELEMLGKDYPKVKIGSINEAIDAYCKQLKTQIV
jgi:CRISPR-associated protein Cst2